MKSAYNRIFLLSCIVFFIDWVMFNVVLSCATNLIYGLMWILILLSFPTG